MSANPETAKATPSPVAEEETVRLKDPQLAALLAWLIPGMGHLYQGRTAKGLLFFICIFGMFAYGLYLGGSSELGWGRVVYFSWEPGNRRLAYLCQIGAGLPALPALIQANRYANNKPVWWGGFMAPPRSENPPERIQGPDHNAEQPTAHQLHVRLARYFELGSAYTMMAGLLNLLAIYDAWAGPVFARRGKESEEDRPDGEGEGRDG